MNVTQLQVGGFDKNFSYFIQDGKSADFAIVDPAGNVQQYIAEEIKKGLKPAMILVTHSHFDHIEKIPQILSDHHIPVYAHKNAKGRMEVPNEFLRYVIEGESIPIGNSNLKVMHTPGHIDDAVCFHITKEETQDATPKLLTGDTLFVEGCGRADLTNSNVDDLYQSLERIKSLENETTIYPGHDYGSKPFSDVLWEKNNNTYFLSGSLEEFRRKRLPR